MKDKKFAIWDDDFLEYYKNLQNLIGTYAIFDMLGEMEIPNYDDDPVMSYALKTETKFEKTRKKLSVYQFLLDPKKLLKVATVARRDRPEKDFYQRQLIAKKLKALAKFHRSGGISPNNIVIGFPPNVVP